MKENPRFFALSGKKSSFEITPEIRKQLGLGFKDWEVTITKEAASFVSSRREDITTQAPQHRLHAILWSTRMAIDTNPEDEIVQFEVGSYDEGPIAMQATLEKGLKIHISRA